MRVTIHKCPLNPSGKENAAKLILVNIYIEKYLTTTLKVTPIRSDI